jgi:hypothetical protein
MPELVIRLLIEGTKDSYADVVVDVPAFLVPHSQGEEDASARFSDYLRKKCPVAVTRVIRRGTRILVEVERVPVS